MIQPVNRFLIKIKIEVVFQRDSATLQKDSEDFKKDSKKYENNSVVLWKDTEM